MGAVEVTRIVTWRRVTGRVSVVTIGEPCEFEVWRSMRAEGKDDQARGSSGAETGLPAT